MILVGGMWCLVGLGLVVCFCGVRGGVRFFRLCGMSMERWFFIREFVIRRRVGFVGLR